LGTLLSRCEATLEELMEARIPLEVQVVALLARGAQVPDLTKAAQANRDMDESSDNQEWSDADQAFHCCLAKATGNQILVTITETVTGLTFKLRADALLLADFPDWPFAERHHAQIQ
jgi:GntR family transcriptional repressor for pyruvate dehydrogenase complex